MDIRLQEAQPRPTDSPRLQPQGPQRTIEIGVNVFVNIRHYVELEGRVGPLHDHSWRMEVVCRALQRELEKDVVVEFATIRDRIQALARAWDGQILNDLPAFRGSQPTVENALLKLNEQIRDALADLPVTLASVTIWESPTHFVRLSEI